MTVVSLPLLLFYSLVMSAILVLLNRRGVSVAGAAAATLLTAPGVAVVQLRAFGPAVSKQQAFRLWLLFVLLPCAVEFGASRLSLFQRRPWWLLLAGPVSFVLAVVVAMVAYNVLFTLGHAG